MRIYTINRQLAETKSKLDQIKAKQSSSLTKQANISICKLRDISRVSVCACCWTSSKRISAQFQLFLFAYQERRWQSQLGWREERQKPQRETKRDQIQAQNVSLLVCLRSGLRLMWLLSYTTSQGSTTNTANVCLASTSKATWRKSTHASSCSMAATFASTMAKRATRGTSRATI